MLQLHKGNRLTAALVLLPRGIRPLSRCYHHKLTLESLLNQFKSENSFLGRRTYPDIELVKACVVLDMFKTFTRSGKSVVQLLKNEVLYHYNTRV